MKPEKIFASNLCIKCETENNDRKFFDVCIKDERNDIIVHEIQPTNKYCYYNLEESGKYIIKISSLICKQNPKAAIRWITIVPECKNMQFFKFNNIKRSPKYVSMNFTLNDAKFINYPIQKGVIHLWHKTLP